MSRLLQNEQLKHFSFCAQHFTLANENGYGIGEPMILNEIGTRRWKRGWNWCHFQFHSNCFNLKLKWTTNEYERPWPRGMQNFSTVEKTGNMEWWIERKKGKDSTREKWLINQSSTARCSMVTATGHSCWSHLLVTAAGCRWWSQLLVTGGGHNCWSQLLDTVAGHIMCWSQLLVTCPGHSC